MNWKAYHFFPIMGAPLSPENSMKMDFSPNNKGLESVDLAHTESFYEFVFGQLEDAGKTFGLGGYLEHRAIYQRSERFETSAADFRNIHLGVDVWAKAGTKVYCPIEGRVFSIQNNAGFGDYGPTIILKHELAEKKLYSLYGHLSLTDLALFEINQVVKAGELLCHIGPYPENGDWPPHLHFQLMFDMLGNTGDFPGVCSQRETGKYKTICPDPNLILRCPLI
ncbi:peptidoglycan DD-metalloendopeptidase family protein [Algoriphagus sp.]|uniref:peptidoglycan DD-metalloendopeptidase family protein n=1 Tax=Algoriphagus sp. TaxID=1872435 RepID=UPI0025D19555|nr:peptidoglycan DD-metalloendopeptidase family protein [Algoriphagus sp.]